MSGHYAEGTTVPVEKSRAEIEQILRRYGATQLLAGWDDERDLAFLGFTAYGRQVKFLLPLPPLSDFKTRTVVVGRSYRREQLIERTPEQQVVARDQAVRQRWRALALAVKAKLEAVAIGITTFEQEFLAHIVLPDGQTVGGWLRPQLEHVYATAEMPRLLGPGGDR